MPKTLPATRRMIIEEGLCTVDELDELETGVDARVNAAALFASESSA